MTALSADVILGDPRWKTFDIEGICDRACEALVAELKLTGSFEFCVLATNDEKMVELNETFRGKGKSTNVLSWPSKERGAKNAGDRPEHPIEDELGDIAISYDTCSKEANKSGLEIHDHVTHLMVHGVLHLLGYDHERDEDATLMERIEISTLERLTIANPY